MRRLTLAGVRGLGQNKRTALPHIIAKEWIGDSANPR